MTPEEQAAAEAAQAASQQTPEEIAEAEEAARQAAEAQKQIYTPEELAGLTPTDIDIERVDPSVRPIVENTIRDYKELQADHTRKSQELAELKKTPAPEERFFDDETKNFWFKEYLKSPIKVLAQVNGLISQWESVVPDDGVEEYRKARKNIADLNAVKDEYREKRDEVQSRTRQDELADAKLINELGAEAPALMDYAKSLGYSDRDFKTRPELREALKRTYKIDHAALSALKKEVKSAPHKAAAPGGAGGGDKPLDEFNPNLSTAERIEASRKRRTAEGKF